MTGREMRSLRTQFCASEQAGTDSGRAALSCPRAPASEKETIGAQGQRRQRELALLPCRFQKCSPQPREMRYHEQVEILRNDARSDSFQRGGADAAKIS